MILRKHSSWAFGNKFEYGTKTIIMYKIVYAFVAEVTIKNLPSKQALEKRHENSWNTIMSIGILPSK